SEIFINTPSFKIMWYLNKYAQEVYEKEKAKTTKEILGISLIEMSSKLYIQLGKWILMNIEVITKHNEDRLDFFSLPYEVLLVISDREIASLLNNIGEQSILNLVLDGDFKNIIEIGREILKLGLKPKGERKKQKDFINKIIKINKNLENMTSFSQKLFKLYALIEEKLKGGILV
ncbi:MAG: hypothetical protein N2516_06315, partial [Dictyoglomaceae bacterium]|nr:hypothetical protein [Dictyoglomaceae bacterium]